uniref:CC domain-containing protein n=1 Tax=Syphacia muris TaxID=451379 RepID=A0A0N5ATV3_9BILA
MYSAYYILSIICYNTFVISVLCVKPNFRNISQFLRPKRQIYYLCGIYPNQYYSSRPCYYTETECPNGGKMIGVGCTNAIQCTPYHIGKSTCINGCCCTVPESSTSTSNFDFGYCYNGQLSQVQCSSYEPCESGQTCMNGLCCTTTSEEYLYTCGGIAALSSCADDGTCENNMHCNPSNYCCECPVGRSSGPCNQGVCPSGFQCNSNGYCCATCPGDETPYGACRDGVCGGGRTCHAGNICC